MGSLVQGNDGNFYGITSGDLDNQFGTVFQLTPAGVLTTLYSFSGPDGASPYAGLVLGSDGNFYGTTFYGGATYVSETQPGQGTVFRMTPAGVLTTLHSFDGDDGANPNAGLVEGSDGNFYGTTTGGGKSTNDGTVFRLTPAGTLKTLHRFGGPDGATPFAELVAGSDGSFYGTTAYGGAAYVRGGNSGQGTVFQITRNGVITTLYSFSGPDGATPHAGLVIGTDGNFYGTTQYGGATYGGAQISGLGTVFQLTPAGVLTTLYSFSGPDGAFPVANLVLGSDGNFYGTTSIYFVPENANDGTVFQITPAGVLTTLHTFHGADGTGPTAALVQGSDGNFYGATYSGGANLDGTIFKLGFFPAINSVGNANAIAGQPFSYQITASNQPASFAATGLPAGLRIDPVSGLISGTPTAAGDYAVTLSAGNSDGTGTAMLTLIVADALGRTPIAFFSDETSLSNGVYYLAFPNGNYFGYYAYVGDADYIYHFDLGYEFFDDADDGKSGVYFYDFASSDFFYTSPTFSFPYLYDFDLNSVVYYYPDPNNPGHYNTNGVRYFYVFNTGQIISK